jgi:hypothetical protein
LHFSEQSFVQLYERARREVLPRAAFYVFGVLLQQALVGIYVLTPSEVEDATNFTTVMLRQVLDIALDHALLMSPDGAHELETALNRYLPPVWPGETPIKIELNHTENPCCLGVTVAPRFQNRLHRFPFEDGFLLCPVPHCTRPPNLVGTLHGISDASGQPSSLIEYTCDAGHHWQCIFRHEDDVNTVSVVRIKGSAIALQSPGRLKQ